MNTSEILKLQEKALKGIGVTPEIAKEMDKQMFSSDKLLNALFWVWDGFDRALINCFFVYDTAECILQNKDLEGDGVHVGVRKLEWGDNESRAGSRPIFEAFAGEPITKTDKVWTYDYLGIPVFVHIFEEDPCILQTNQILYRNEYLKLPNPYKRFLERYGELKFNI